MWDIKISRVKPIICFFRSARGKLKNSLLDHPVFFTNSSSAHSAPGLVSLLSSYFLILAFPLLISRPGCKSSVVSSISDLPASNQLMTRNWWGRLFSSLRLKHQSSATPLRHLRRFHIPPNTRWMIVSSRKKLCYRLEQNRWARPRTPTCVKLALAQSSRTSMGVSSVTS